jgi:hypothetical protein
VVQPCEFNDDISQIDIGYGQIRVGQYIGLKTNNSEYGWYLDADTVLPINGLACDYVGTIRHELGHALGITCERDTNVTINSDRNAMISFAADVPVNSWNTHLIDQYQNPAKPGMKIITSADFKKMKEENPALQRSDYFIVDRVPSMRAAATCRDWAAPFWQLAVMCAIQQMA